MKYPELPIFKSRRKVRKDYFKGSYANPYFKTDQQIIPRQGSFNTSLYLKILAVAIVIYVVIYSELPTVTTIEVSGLDLIPEQEFQHVVNQNLKHWRWYLFPQRNMIFLSKKALKQGIEDKYSLEYLTVTKGWKSLSIKLKEKISHAIVYNQNEFYFADQQGRVMQELPQEQVSIYWDRYPILNVGQGEIQIGQEVATPDQMTFMLALDQAILNTNLKKHGYERGEDVNELRLVSKDGWRAYFDITSDLNVALENLILVLNEKIEDPKRVEYIDLRFGNKVFYK